MIIDLCDVLLRKPETRDRETLYRMRNDAWNVARLGGFSTGYALQDIDDWIEAHRTRHDEVLWVIAGADTDTCLGHVGLYRLDSRVRKAEFAILIGDPEWRGRGLGRKVTSAVVNYGFSQLNLHRIELSVLATNEAAVKLYEGIGFAVEGTQRDAQFRDGRYVDLLLMAILEPFP